MTERPSFLTALRNLREQHPDELARTVEDMRAGRIPECGIVLYNLASERAKKVQETSLPSYEQMSGPPGPHGWDTTQAAGYLVSLDT